MMKMYLKEFQDDYILLPNTFLSAYFADKLTSNSFLSAVSVKALFL